MKSLSQVIKIDAGRHLATTVSATRLASELLFPNGMISLAGIPIQLVYILRMEMNTPFAPMVNPRRPQKNKESGVFALGD